jgi:omega-amidase
VKVCIVQTATALGDLNANLEAVRAAVQGAATDSPDVVVLPEAWNLGFLPGEFSQVEESRNGPAYALMQELAAELGANLIGGSILTREGGHFYNRSFVFNRSGEEVASYDKMNLFTPMGEDQHVRPGEEAGRFDLEGHVWGSLICYDLRFPVIARALAFSGAVVLAVPAQWPGERIEVWRVLLQARAIENQLFVVGCNGCGAGPDGPVGGHSMVVGPTGEILWEAGDKLDETTVDLDLAEVDAARQAIPAFYEAFERHVDNHADD